MGKRRKLAKQAECEPLARWMREVATLLEISAPGRLVSRLMLAVRLAHGGAVCLAMAGLAAREAGACVEALTHLLLGQAGDAWRTTARTAPASAGTVPGWPSTLALHGVEELLMHVAELCASDRRGVGRRSVEVMRALVVVGRTRARQREEVLHDAEVHGARGGRSRRCGGVRGVLAQRADAGGRGDGVIERAHVLQHQ